MMIPQFVVCALRKKGYTTATLMPTFSEEKAALLKMKLVVDVANLAAAEGIDFIALGVEHPYRISFYRKDRAPDYLGLPPCPCDKQLGAEL